MWCPRMRSQASSVYLRADGTAGDDDPVCWPQFYDKEAPYLAAIPLNSPNPNSAVSIFRNGLLAHHLTPTGLRTVDNVPIMVLLPSFKSTVSSAISRLLNRAKSFLCDFTPGSFQDLREFLKLLKEVKAKMLESMETLQNFRILFGLTGRLCLMIEGYINYYGIYLPKSVSSLIPSIPHDVVGLFVKNDKRLCRKYVKMGIPVWHVQSIESIPDPALYCSTTVSPVSYITRRPPPPGLWDDGCFRALCPLFSHPTTASALMDKMSTLTEMVNS